MSNLNDAEQIFVCLIPNKLLMQPLNFVEKYYFLAEILILEHR